VCVLCVFACVCVCVLCVCLREGGGGKRDQEKEKKKGLVLFSNDTYEAGGGAATILAPVKFIMRMTMSVNAHMYPNSIKSVQNMI